MMQNRETSLMKQTSSIKHLKVDREMLEKSDKKGFS
jgi:hypothetical protein